MTVTPQTLMENEMQAFTSNQLEAIEETERFESITEQCTFQYQLTDGELGWLRWIGERYEIASYLWSVLEVDDNDTGTVTIDVLDVSDALTADGVDSAPCLSDDTQLQRLIWYIGPND